LLSELAHIEDRRCMFVCCLVFYYGKRRFLSVQETLEGEVAHTPRGVYGFGYDPIVYLPKLGKTVAELTIEEKNILSHRGKAAQKMSRMLAECSLLHECK